MNIPNAQSIVSGPQAHRGCDALPSETPAEIKQLLEAGFEYFCEEDGLMFFRKRK